MRIGVYPGTFDPITNGHIDIIERASKLFDKLYVIVPKNGSKKELFTLEERVELIKEATKEFSNVYVDSTDKLTVEYCKDVNATAMVRGLRMVSDFEYELQMATINKSLCDNIETIFIMARHEYSFLSSSSVKELASFNADIEKFVPTCVINKLKEKYRG